MTGFKKLRRLSSWRRISLGTWDAPRDPTVYGWLEVELSGVHAYLDAQNREAPAKVTITHLIGKAVANAIAARPEVNAIVRRGRQIYQREGIDIFFQVAFDDGENLSGATIRDADRKSVREIAQELASRVQAIRGHGEHALRRPDAMSARLPGLVRRPLLRVAEYLTHDVGIDLSWLGLPQDPFGSAMVTNVGMFGVPHAFAPLVSFSRVPVVVAVGTARDAAVVVDGEVAVREVLTLGVTLDHRLIDGYQAGRIAQRLSAILADPAGALD